MPEVKRTKPLFKDNKGCVIGQAKKKPSFKLGSIIKKQRIVGLSLSLLHQEIPVRKCHPKECRQYQPELIYIHRYLTLLLQNKRAAGERGGMGKVNRKCAAADGGMSGAARTLLFLH